MHEYLHWIDGRHQAPEAGAWIDSIDPFTGEVWARVPRGNAIDASTAVAAAHRAMKSGPWATMTASERGRIMRGIADAVLRHAARLSEFEVRDNGKLLAEMSGMLKYTSDYWHYYAGLADKIEGAVMPVEKSNLLGLTLREPVGVVLALTAWNSPISFIAQKCAPALAAGCAVVIKPSEFSSVSSLEFAEITREAGLPEGVLNVVTGYGAEIGAALVDHHDVAHITFTGSDATGARIYQAAARNMKRVTMELGGKSPNIIFEDADLDAAAGGAISGIFGASGQMCSAGSRLLVQNSVRAAVTERLLVAARQIRLGNPMDKDTQMGPLSTEPQFRKVLDYIDIARTDGATCLHGGNVVRMPGLHHSQFVEPTIFTDVTNSMRIAREEVFGPILSIMGFDTEEEAVAIANDTPYGLSAGVWTRDIARLVRVSKALEVGTVWGNTYRTYSYTLPFGGRKFSGIGRENGIEAVNGFLETKSIMISTSSAPTTNSFVPR